jgi:hypothetical protein
VRAEKDTRIAYFKSLSNEVLCDQLGSVITVRWEGAVILDLLSGIFYFSKDEDEKNRILTAIGQYINRVVSLDSLPNYMNKPIGRILYNARRNGNNSQPIYDALVAAVDLVPLTSVASKNIFLLLMYDNFHSMASRTLGALIRCVNQSSHISDHVVCGIESLFQKLFALFFSDKVMDRPTFLNTLRRLKGDSIIIGVVSESLYLFLQALVSNHAGFSCIIKKTAVNLLMRSMRTITYLPYQVASYTLLNQLALTAYDIRLQQYALNTLKHLKRSDQVPALATVAYDLDQTNTHNDFLSVPRPQAVSVQAWDLFFILCAYRIGAYASCIEFSKRFKELYSNIPYAVSGTGACI